MIDPEIAKRYAIGLFLAAEKHEVLDRVLEEQKEMLSLFNSQPEFKSFLEMPHISSKEKRELVEKALSRRFHPVLYHFLLLLLRKHRLGYLIPIVNEYEKQLKQHKGIIQVTATTATPLEKTTAEKLASKLEKKTGKKVEMLLKVEPEIIGGISIVLGNQIIDDSIRHHLAQLKDVMLGLEVY